MSTEIRQQVTDDILNALANDLVPWQKPWLGHRNDGPPTNVLTNFSFRGINRVLLQLASNRQGFKSKWWGTKKVWNVFGYQVTPHQERTQVFYEVDGNLGTQAVFNAEQVEGPGIERYLVLQATAKRLPDYDAAERVIAATNAHIRHMPRNGALYYRLPLDHIEMPLKTQFLEGTGKLPAYYGTLLHEANHWSEHRLRWCADPHLSIKARYAIGEWRADLGSAFLADEIGIPLYHNPASHRMFGGQWMKLMKCDNTLVFRVASAASEAASFILSFSERQKHIA